MGPQQLYLLTCIALLLLLLPLTLSFVCFAQAFGEKPYGTMNNFEVVRKVEDGYRMDRPPKCPEAVHALMHMCWEAERRQRPTFVAVVDTLEEMTQDATNGVNIGLCEHKRREALERGSWKRGT